MIPLNRYLSDERAQATTEYILIIGLISIPIWVAFKFVLQKFLRDFIGALVGRFTRG